MRSLFDKMERSDASWALWHELFTLGTLTECRKLLLDKRDKLNEYFLPVGLVIANNMLIQKGSPDSAAFACDMALYVCSLMKEDTAAFQIRFMGFQATAYRRLGFYEAALGLYYKAQGYCQQQGMFDELATINMDCAIVYIELGHYEAALDLYNKAQDYCQQQGMFDEVITSIMNKATIYAELGRYEAALDSYDEIQDYCQQQGMLDKLAAIIINKAGVNTRLERYEAALDLYNKAQDHCQQQGMFDELAAIIINKAAVYRELRHYKEAIRLYDEALSKYDIPTIRWRCHFGKGLVYQQKPGSVFALKKAHRCYKNAIGIIDNWRRELAQDELKTKFLHDKDSVYAQMVKLCLLRNNREEAYEYTERAKSHALLELILQVNDKTKVESSIGNHSGKILQLEKCWEELQNIEEKDILEIAKREQELLQGTQASAETNNVETLELEAVQALLPPDAALVEYYHVHGTFVIFVLTKDTLKCYERILVDDVLEQALPLLFDQEDRSGGNQIAHIKRYEQPELARKNLNQLYQLLITPIERYIDDKAHLVIVPHGVLHYLPFSALYDGWEYLIQRKIISISPSASILAALKENNPKRRKSCIAFINPMIEPERDTLSSKYNLCRYFDDCDEFKREYATKANVKEHVSGKDIIHFGCHAYINPSNALLSYLALSNGNPEEPMTDPMYAIDVFNLDLSSATLAVLGACNTMRGALHPGDEIIALTRGFFHAGASSLLASLWEVDDADTQLLMDYFYRVFTDKRQPLDKAAALQNAQCLFLEEYKEHPYFWAGFQLLGDWD